MHSKISIGNDIVDLKYLEPDLHPRFIKRVFSPTERQRVSSDRSALWLNWAAKEAAYKAVRRLDPSIIFEHAHFEYHPAQRCVRYGNYHLPCQYTINSDYVHVVCASTQGLLGSGVIANWVDDLPEHLIEQKPVSHNFSSINHSQAVRMLAIEKIGRILNVPAQDLEIVSLSETRSSATPHTTWDSIPYLSIKGQITSHLLTFSHHGRFVFCSFLKVT